MGPANQSSSGETELRSDVAHWLASHWSPAIPKHEWLDAVVDAGYACPGWPVDCFGLGLPPELSRAVAEEFARVGAPGSGKDISSLPGNVIVAHGTTAQKAQFLRSLVTGELNWCLLYSEPAAGSDLAAVQTRAARDGDEWIVNGQKVWTSAARTAHYGLLIARTNWDVPKHQGISFFFFPMDQPGVEVRPIRQITGGSSFNEVFLDDARVPDANRLGDVDNGWRVLQTALAYERVIMGASRGIMAAIVGAGADGETQEDAASDAGATDSVSDLVVLARETGSGGDPVVRQAIAYAYSLRQVNRWNGLRARAHARQGSSSPLASLGKLAMSRILHTTARIKGSLLGAESMLESPTSGRAHSVNLESMTAYVNSIGGGTDQIQRNIIGERILGLPREPQVDRDVPFRDVLKSPAVQRFG